MRVSRIQAAENHERVLEIATTMFRERGIDGIGVADLMKAAGLTHGGFYGHFKSKEDLVAQACGRAVSKMRKRWIDIVDHATGDPLEALAETYLTPKHRDNAGRGCTMAAIGSEIARQGSAVRRSVTDELRPFLDYLAGIVDGGSSTLRRQKALAIYASMVGALVVSRSVDDMDLSNEVLAAVAATMHANHASGVEVKSTLKRRRLPATKLGNRKSKVDKSRSTIRQAASVNDSLNSKSRAGKSALRPARS